jgi:hypothetical protein
MLEKINKEVVTERYVADLSGVRKLKEMGYTIQDKSIWFGKTQSGDYIVCAHYTKGNETIEVTIEDDKGGLEGEFGFKIT